MSVVLAAGVALILMSVGSTELATRIDPGPARVVVRQVGLFLRGLGSIVVTSPFLFLAFLAATGRVS